MDKTIKRFDFACMVMESYHCHETLQYLRDLKASHDALQDQLAIALPYVEDACAQAGYKIGTEKKVTGPIHAALKAAEALK